MDVNANLVRELRDKTGAGIMDCKKALAESKGELEQAVVWLREKGIAQAAKRAGRVASEGSVGSYIHAGGKLGVLVEVNCETDFVARGPDFRAFADAVAQCALAAQPARLEALIEARLASGESVEERRRALVAKLGENIGVRRFAVLVSPDQLGAYVHGTRIGALVAVKGGAASLAYDLAMHVAASNPGYLTESQVPAEVMAKEREILTEQARGEGKPPQIVAKMVEGRLRKALSEITLAGQPFVKDPDVSIEKLLKGAKAEVLAFERFEVGAGIEKKTGDFVAEVMIQAKGAGPVRH
ncbi:MAG: translation elongation factor Ts [Candidatus Binataceae bacterium]